VEVVASLSQGHTAAAQCGLFTYESVPVIFEPPCIYVWRMPVIRALLIFCWNAVECVQPICYLSDRVAVPSASDGTVVHSEI